MSSHAASLRRRSGDEAPARPEPGSLPAPPRPAPAGERRPRRRRRLQLRGALVVVALVAGVLGVATWVVLDARGTEGAPARATDRVVSVGAASITVPADWAPARAADAGVPGLDESSAVLAPAPGIRAYAIATLAPRGLPAALAQLLGPLGTARSTRLAGLPALAYAARSVAGDRTAELTIARTALGELAVACIARTYSWAGAAGCADEVVSTTAPAPEHDRRGSVT